RAAAAGLRSRRRAATRQGDGSGAGRERSAVMPDLLEEFRAFKPNSRAHAIYWLRTGALHPDIHHVIRERVEPSVSRVEKAVPGIRERLLAEIPSEPPAAEPSPARPLPIAPRMEDRECVPQPFEGYHPPPTAVAEYFRRKRHTTAEFAREDILN